MTREFRTADPNWVRRGQLLYEARLALWVWFLVTLVVAPLSVSSLWTLISSEQGLGWIASISFAFMGLVMPAGCLSTLYRRVLFYEGCIVTRSLFRKTRCIEYSSVKFVARDQALTIYLTDGRPIHIPKLEGNFDRIEEIVEARRAATEAMG